MNNQNEKFQQFELFVFISTSELSQKNWFRHK